MREVLNKESKAEELSPSEDSEVRVENVEIKDWRKSKRPREVTDSTKHFVYVLTDVEGKLHSYVGYTPHLDKRLTEHNAGTGANSTKGEEWKHFAVFQGFHDRKTALRFESLMHLHSVDHVGQWLEVANEIIGKYTEFDGVRLIDE